MNTCSFLIALVCRFNHRSAGLAFIIIALLSTLLTLSLWTRTTEASDKLTGGVNVSTGAAVSNLNDDSGNTAADFKPTLSDFNVNNAFRDSKESKESRNSISFASTNFASTFSFDSPTANFSLVNLTAASPTAAASVSAPILMTPAFAPAPVPAGTTAFDFDNDGKADVSRWNSTSKEWMVRSSVSGTTSTVVFGNTGSVLAPADYDNDGKTDYATFTASTGAWTIKQSSNSATVNYTLGQTGDQAVPADYDGDGKADAAVWRSSNGTWYVRKSSTGTTISQQFGQAGDIPVVGNYDGDTKADYAVFRPASGLGTWYVLPSSTGSLISYQWGNAGDIPVPADYDGDGKTDYAVFRPESGTWYAVKSSGTNGAYLSAIWGNFGDQPVPADYDGDSKADFAVWRPSTGVWYVANSSYPNQASTPYSYYQLGGSGDYPTPAAYVKQAGFTVASSDLNIARLSPKNATGGTNLYSRNFSWSTGLVGLPGRAGLNMGLGLSYNSLVWTRVGTGMYFDVDYSNVSPGFRFGFPVIESSYLDSQTGQYAYLMVSPSGARTVLRQTIASGIYEATDSSYLQLTVNSKNPNDPSSGIKNLELRATDGTKLTFEMKAGAFRCSEVKDANGNFITVNHDDNGLLQTVTDTLGRVVTVNYDAQLYPISITQPWQTGTHTWATFTYATTPVNPTFTGLTNYGPANSTAVKALQKVTFADGSSNTFDYNDYGQVYRVNQLAADNHELNHIAANLAVNLATTPNSFDTGAQTDCPRFTETRNFAENFNNGAEVIVANTILNNQPLPGGTGQATMIEVTEPDSTPEQPNRKVVSRSFVHPSGWDEGLPLAIETWANDSSGGTLERKRLINNIWTQDNTSSPYIQNPRVIETKTSDNTNTKRTTVDYYTQPTNPAAALYGLVREVDQYDGDQATILKRRTNDYNLNAAYVSRQIIGLVAETKLFDGTSNLLSKVSYNYDEGDFTGGEQNILPVQHDNTNYGASLSAGRGNLTSATRWDATAPDNLSVAVTSRVKYNTAGSVASQSDPLSRTIVFSYADAFVDANFQPDSVSHNAFAYPTKLTDPRGSFSTIKYRFDIGAGVRSQSPAPLGQSTGKITTRSFDAVGRPDRETIINTGAYTRFEYPVSQNYSRIFKTITDVNGNGQADAADEVLTEIYVDGTGQTRAIRTEHPGSTGGWSGVLIEYDVMGRATGQSAPTEINNAWQLAGDDAARGWLWKRQEYDWKGRTTREVNAAAGIDKLISYEGCGCAGGAVTTIKGELVQRDDQPNQQARRSQKIYSDILGRDYKTETLNWDGSVYSSNVTKYNGRDQAEWSKQYVGAAPADALNSDSCPAPVVGQPQTCEIAKWTYDGHGRLQTQHVPGQDADNATVYDYYNDDRVHSKTDARGASSTYTYEERGLLGGINYSLPASATAPSSPGPGDCVPGNPDYPDCLPDPTPTPSPTPVPTPTFTAVTFEYNDLGNRTKMTDETGVTTYAYDALSRVTSENKHLRDDWNIAQHDFSIQYNYNLSGQIKSVTDPFGQEIDYSVDKIGRIKGISGSPFDSAEGGSGTISVTNYITDVAYRAWGGLKSIDYGNTVKMSQTFDNRLRVDEFKVWKDGQATPYIKKNYQYYDDDNLKFSSDTGDAIIRGDSHYFDRSYAYDVLGRLSAARTGAESRGETGNIDRNLTPYKQDYSYNAFGNVTSRQTFTWTQADNETNTWVNERHSSWTYDADGRIKDTPESSYAYDATGAITTATLKQKRMLIQQRDGEAKPVRRDQYIYQSYHYNLDKTEYSIYSTVLGKLLTEVDSSGRKTRTFVYGGSGVIATQNIERSGGSETKLVKWEHRDPSNASYLTSGASGLMYYYGETGQAELDPLGANVGTSNPNDQSTPNLVAGPGGGFGYPGFGDPFGGASCYVDWTPRPCSFALQVLSQGGGEIGPLDQFRLVQNPRSGEIAWGQYRNYGNSQSGWWADTNGPNAGDVDSVHIPFNSDQNAYHPFGNISTVSSGSGGSGIGGVSVAAPPPPSPAADPCAGNKGKLNFSPGGNRGISHITPRHILPNPDPNASRFTFPFYMTSLSSKQNEVINFGQTVFNNATGYTQSNSPNSSIAYVYAFPDFDYTIPSFIPGRRIGVRGFQDIGVESSISGGKITNVMSLIIDPDCSSVITAFPGFPTDFNNRPGANVTGNPRLGASPPGWTWRW